MEKFIKGNIVVVSFPFSDLSSSKRRPALVLSDFIENDVILCQITSKPYSEYSICIADEDFAEGNLPMTSYVKPNRIFTAHKDIILEKVGTLNTNMYEKIIQSIYNLIK
jgi:mRNA interferase MazF